jgi:hypothetical protein
VTRALVPELEASKTPEFVNDEGNQLVRCT